MVFVLVQLHKYFEDREYVYLVLEKCDLDLDSYLKAKCTGLDEEQARKYMKQIVDGLLYLHKHNLLHRDVKPRNLLLTKDMNIVNIRVYYSRFVCYKFENSYQCLDMLFITH